ncbi:MAG: RluA family pseudouridine synthase [Desulfovibrio sp.]|nr:RluA family pseudouridine synthase [Desulfovibrio sp.]
MSDELFDFPPVEEAESGQKLLRFLERRLSLPSNLLHRWIRTGQIRRNGKRCKPFERVAVGDIVRLPPFAAQLSEQSREDELSAVSPETPSLPPLIGEIDGLRAYFKPVGMPVQPGSDHDDALSARLVAACPELRFKPTPCHRLDKDTSGAILVACSYEALRRAQEWLANGLARKEYLAWVEGDWPYDGPRLLRHFLRKETRENMTKMRAYKSPVPYAKESLCVVRPLRRSDGKTLLQIWLRTGRTHQIRAQLAAVGFPVVGDEKYGKPGALSLHSMRIILPDGAEFVCAPEWDSESSVGELPPPIPVDVEAPEI